MPIGPNRYWLANSLADIPVVRVMMADSRCAPAVEYRNVPGPMGPPNRSRANLAQSGLMHIS